jgi:hypothetical protein
MTRAEKVVCWAALPVGFLCAYLVSFTAMNAWAVEPVYSFFYGLLAFLFVQLVIALWLSARSPADSEAEATTPVRARPVRRPPADKWLQVRLSKEATEALQAIMSLEGDGQAPSAVINYLLIRHQRVLRKTLLGDWEPPGAD